MRGIVLQHRILLVEDDEAISEMVRSYLMKEGYRVESVFDGEAAEQAFHHKGPFDLVLLDQMLPERSGMDILQSIRKSSLVPVLIVSAKDTDVDKALGLGFGADDYISKPFSMIELAARVKAAIRRAEYATSRGTSGERVNPKRSISLGGLTVDFDNFSAIKNGEEVKLTAKEFHILKLFMTHPGRVFTKAQIYGIVWEDEYFGDENVINVHMRRLRERLKTIPPSRIY